MKKKCAVLLVLAMMTCIVFTACSSDEAVSDTGTESTGEESGTEGETVVIGFSNSEMDHPYRIAMYDEMMEAVEANGLNWEVILSDAAHDYAKQANDIEDLIVQGVQGLIVSPGDSSTSISACLDAMAQGIPVVLVDRVLDDESAYDVFCGGDNYQVGVAAAEYIAEQLDGEGKVVQLQGTLGASATTERTAGFEDTIAQYPGIELVANVSANYNREEALATMEDILVSQDEIDYVFAQNDSMAYGGILACEAAGRTDILFVGADGEMDALNMIAEKGQYAATVVYPRGTAEAVETLAAILDGTWTGEKEVIVDTPIITQENVDSMMQYGY